MSPQPMSGEKSRGRLGFVELASTMACLMLLLSGTGADARCSKPVVLYYASWCPYCRDVRDFLVRNNIRYTKLDATTQTVKADMIKRFGDTSVPVTVVGRSVVYCADKARIRQLCR